MDIENFTLEQLDQFIIRTEFPDDETIAARIGLVCSLYSRHPHTPATRLALARCGDHYQKLFGEHLRGYIRADGGGRVKRYPAEGIDLEHYVQKEDDVQKKPLMPTFFSGEDIDEAPAYGFTVFDPVDESSPIEDCPSVFSAVLPVSWLSDKPGQQAFQKLVLHWCELLQPYHGYAGLGIVQSFDTVESERTQYLVYPLARRFPGLEVEDVDIISSELLDDQGEYKIKGVNWLTALDDQCFEKLGGRNRVLKDLSTEIQVMDYPGGTLIQAGEMPQIGDVNKQHVPRYYRELSQKLKPLRMTFAEGQFLLTPNEDDDRDETEASNDWLARFD